MWFKLKRKLYKEGSCFQVFISEVDLNSHIILVTVSQFAYIDNVNFAIVRNI